MKLETLSDLLTLPADTLIDVRSPSEYAEDHLPGAVSLPVLDDAERARVGTIYKQESPFLARKVGAALVARNAAHTFEAGRNLFDMIDEARKGGEIHCVLVDESQFLETEQVWQLARVADDLKIPVMCYGLRTDFQGQLFPGSAALLAIADNLREVRTICWCGSKATMVVRLGAGGEVQEEGDQIAIGDDIYVSLCRKHWRQRRLSG